MGITQECCKQYWTSPGGSTPQSSSCMASDHPSWKLSKLDKPDIWDFAGEVVMHSCGPFHMDEQRQDNQLEAIYNRSVLIQDVALKTYQEWWTIDTGGGRGSERYVLATLHDDDWIEVLMLSSNNWNHLTGGKQMTNIKQNYLY